MPLAHNIQQMGTKDATVNAGLLRKCFQQLR